MASRQADLMSQNLTQLSYDISSFYNISVEEAYTKVQSGFAGEIEPLRRLGFALDEASLKQLAFDKGITLSIENMTQAQKSQLRYVAILEQAQRIGVTGDMARTIDSASNSARILKARLQQLSRAVGNMLMPMLTAALPYVTAFVQVLTEGAQAIADFLGFELPKFDIGGEIASGYEDIAAATNEATAANEKFKGSLAGVDQLNIIGSKTESKGSGTGTGGSYDLGIELPSYDFLNGVESKTKEIAENMKKWFEEALPWIQAVGTALAGIYIGTKFMDLALAFGKIADNISRFKAIVGTGKAKTLFGLVGGLTAGATSGVLLFNSMKNITKGSDELNDKVMLVTGAVIALGSAITFLAVGNPLGAIITAVVALTGAVLGCSSAVQELADEVYKQTVFTDVGVSIKDISDKYSELTETLTETDKKILENQTAIDENKKTIEGSLGTIQSLTGEFEATGAMSEEAAGKISEAAKKISSSISGNLSTDIQNVILGIGSAWDTVAQNAGKAKEEIISAMYTTKSKGDVIVAELSEKMANAAAILATADKGTAEYEAAYSDYSSAKDKLTEVSLAAIGKEQSTQELQNTLSNLTSDKIAFMDEGTALAAMEQIIDSYDTAYADMLSSKAAAELDVENIKSISEALGLEDLSESDYQAMLGGIEENYKGKIDNLNAITSETVQRISSRLLELGGEGTEKALNDFYNPETFGEGVGFFFTELGAEIRGALGGVSAQQVLTEDIERNTGVYEINAKINEARSKINANQTDPSQIQIGDKRFIEPTFTKEDVDRIREIVEKGSVEKVLYSAAPQITTEIGYARDAVSEAYSESGSKYVGEFNIELHADTTCEIDSEAVGEAATRYSYNQAFITNGK